MSPPTTTHTPLFFPRCLNLISALAQLFFGSLFLEPILPHPRLHPLLGGNLQQRRRERGRGVHSEGDRGDISTG